MQAKKKVTKQGFLGGFTKLTNYVKGVPERKKGGAPARTHIPIDGPVDLPMANPVAEVGAGDLIGELAALNALKQEKGKRAKYYPRSATVRAKTPVTVFEMLPNILNNVLYTSKEFKERLDKGYVERALGSHLRSVPVFANLNDEFLKTLRPPKVELGWGSPRAGDLQTGRRRRFVLSHPPGLRESVAGSSPAANWCSLIFRAARISAKWACCRRRSAFAPRA